MDPDGWLVTVPGHGETTLAQACALAAGCAAVAVAAVTDATFLGRHELGARALVIGIVVGVSTAMIRDWRHSAGVATFGALVFVGFLAHRYGNLTGDASAWRYTALIAFAACLGRSVRGAYPPAAAGERERTTATMPGQGWNR